MKRLLIILILILLAVGGCPELKVDGFSVGVIRLKADMGNAGEIDEYAPVGLVNVKFK